ncbi:MAG: translation elongation factor-like protein [Candidatus Omnitrophica bacterium]|nr:translation elongation factor-like protein [Candidatus Omnitrophota bacterium]
MFFGLFKKKRSLEELGEPLGEITHYFPHVKAAVIKLKKDGLSAGETIYIKGHTSDFEQKVKSMQLDHAPVEKASKGQEVGLRVNSKVRHGDKVYKIS